jgi:hypothetical protein
VFQFINVVGRQLGVSANRMYNADGVELDDLLLVDDDDILFFTTSAGEAFKQPYARSSGGGGGDGAGSGGGGGGAEPGGDGIQGGYVEGYRVNELLGKGSFGRVYRGVHEVTRDVVALKFISKSALGDLSDANLVFTEVNCVQSLSHENVINFFRLVDTPESVVLVFEYASGGDLTDFLKESGALSERFTLELFQQVIAGVSYCHKVSGGGGGGGERRGGEGSGRGEIGGGRDGGEERMDGWVNPHRTDGCIHPPSYSRQHTVHCAARGAACALHCCPPLCIRCLCVGIRCSVYLYLSHSQSALPSIPVLSITSCTTTSNLETFFF